jgi:flagellar protein FlaI
VRLDEKDNSLVYDIIEPTLNEYEINILQKLKEGLVQVIDVRLEDIKNIEKIIEFLENHIQTLITDYNFRLNEKEYVKIFYYIYRDFVGFNKIEAMLRDPYIEDIGCDGFNVPIYVVHSKFGSLRTNVIYSSNEELREFVIKLAERCDRYISYAEPLLDGTLKDGSRVQASLSSDVTARGPTFSIRKFKEVPFTPTDMIRLNTLSPEMLAYLWFIIEHGANILIAGGVSTGKTSMLNTISLFIPTASKIVSIEDTRELNLPHENWIPGVARIGFVGTNVGEVTMFELLRESFRQNPDYLIVGEVRGKEAYVMFQGMASGHPSISTMHAGGVDDVLRRLQTHPINLSPGLLDSLDIVLVMIHAREKGKSARRLKEIVEIQSIDTATGTPHIHKPFVWVPSQDIFEYMGSSWMISKIAASKDIQLSAILKDIANRKKLLNWMYENNVIDINEIVKYINMYYNNPSKIDEILSKQTNR